MQPFSLRYLDQQTAPSRVFTFSEEWGKAALELTKERRKDQQIKIGYDPTPLKQDPLKDGVIELADLKSFFKNPTRFFFEGCLGISLPKEENELPDDEQFEMDGLERWSLRERLFSYAKRTGAAIPEEPPDWIRASGELGPPPMDILQYRKEMDGARKMLEVWNNWHSEAIPRSVLIRAEIEPGLRVSGVVGDTWFQEDKLVGIRKVLNGDVSLYQVLLAWIDYLALTIHNGENELCLTGIITDRKGNWSLVGPKKCTMDSTTAKSLLQSLVNIFLEGHQKAIPFMPRLAGSFWGRQSEQASIESTLDWLSGECDITSKYASFEVKDPFFRLHLPVTQDMADEFEHITREICEPISTSIQFET